MVVWFHALFTVLFRRKRDFTHKKVKKCALFTLSFLFSYVRPKKERFTFYLLAESFKNALSEFSVTKKRESRRGVHRRLSFYREVEPTRKCQRKIPRIFGKTRVVVCNAFMHARHHPEEAYGTATAGWCEMGADFAIFRWRQAVLHLQRNEAKKAISHLQETAQVFFRHLWEN